jgi:ABC-type phosphate/phosphonate transport system substrate-binding protein
MTGPIFTGTWILCRECVSASAAIPRMPPMSSKMGAGSTGLKYQLAVYGDNKELLEALDAGKIDAAGLSYIGRARKYRAIMEFAPQEMYFAVAPQKPTT